VQSFGHDEIIIGEYQGMVEENLPEEITQGKKFGCAWGISQAVQNMGFALLYLASAEIQYHWPHYGPANGEDMFIALFAIMFGAFTAGQASQFGPDVAKAKQAGQKIFSIMEIPSEIDVMGEDQASKKRIPEHFQGEIEFKDVWFRYPTRLNHWVLKGFNLKINPNERIALVGESGQGKSTVICLIMRFYEPEFGTILVDGVDIKEYNLADLRHKMGLVMQEPTLFNYSIKENILYGQLKASNSEIVEACQIANAFEFITNDNLKEAFDDQAESLLEAMTSAKYKQTLIAKLGKGDYNEKVEILRNLTTKEEESGKFKSLTNLIDTRDQSQVGESLQHGYEISAGNRGNKLSGGQK